mmetsp:Transcript_35/g.50  ORF Transcript_35/g.50 Transcript_35/m.50 type:complete len:191 (-) Transcript_35:45-617(-)
MIPLGLVVVCGECHPPCLTNLCRERAGGGTSPTDDGPGPCRGRHFSRRHRNIGSWAWNGVVAEEAVGGTWRRAWLDQCSKLKRKISLARIRRVGTGRTGSTGRLSAWSVRRVDGEEKISWCGVHVGLSMCPPDNDRRGSLVAQRKCSVAKGPSLECSEATRAMVLGREAAGRGSGRSGDLGPSPVWAMTC